MRLMSIILSFFIISGCSKEEAVHSFEQNQVPGVVINGIPANVAENNQTIHLVKGGEFCESYLLEKAAEKRAEDNQIVKLKTFKTKGKVLSTNLKKWLENVDREKLEVYELLYNEKKALLLGSTNLGATGLASNFQNWYILSDTYSIEFLSLSENPKLIFWDKDGLLKYYSVQYSSEFVVNKDWNNVTFDLLKYGVDLEGKSQFISEERNVKCE